MRRSGLIAAQSEQTPRRMRARLEKEGMMDVLRNQIIERKVIELILSHAEFKEVPYSPEGIEAEAIDQGVGGTEESEIPEAQAETARNGGQKRRQADQPEAAAEAAAGRGENELRS